MSLSSQSTQTQNAFEQDLGSKTLSEKQKQAISAAFHSTLLSNPHITLDLVRKTAER